jgi:hypothetical protein
MCVIIIQNFHAKQAATMASVAAHEIAPTLKETSAVTFGRWEGIQARTQML